MPPFAFLKAIGGQKVSCTLDGLELYIPHLKCAVSDVHCMHFVSGVRGGLHQRIFPEFLFSSLREVFLKKILFVNNNSKFKST